MDDKTLEFVKREVYATAPVLLGYDIDFRIEPQEWGSPIIVVELVGYNHKATISPDVMLELAYRGVKQGDKEVILATCYDLLFYLFWNYKISPEVFYSHTHIFGKDYRCTRPELTYDI